MRTTRARKFAAGAAALLALVVAVPALSSTGAGTISFSLPTSRSAIRGSTPVAWSYNAGTSVKESSTVTILATDGSAWKTVAKDLWIQGGGFWWDTRSWPDAIYALRIMVNGTSIQSISYPVYLDNAAPVVHITTPAPVTVPQVGQIAVAQGLQTLDVRATDNLSGVRSVRWLLDGTEIARGYPVKYNFNWKPGKHILQALATDMAGNESSDTVTLIAVAGTSITTDPTPDPTTLIPPVSLPSPSPPPGVGLPVLPTPGIPAVPSVSPSPVDTPSPDVSPPPDASPPAVPSIPPTPLP
jgi:hypothetical protein